MRLFHNDCIYRCFLCFNLFIGSVVSNTLGSIDTIIPVATNINRDDVNEQSFQVNQEEGQIPPSSSNNLNTLVTLDLAGNFDIHVSSPSIIVDGGKSEDVLGDDHITTPLFRWGKINPNERSMLVPKKRNLTSNRKSKGFLIPHVHVGGQYDFRQVWYGLTRIRTTLSWGKALKGSSRSNDLESRQKALCADLSVEKSLDCASDYVLDVGLTVPMKSTLFRAKNIISSNPIQQHSSLALRYETMNQNHDDQPTTSIYAKTNFFHPRIQLVGKAIVKLEQNLHKNFPKSLPSISSSPFLSKIRQQKISLSDESSWIPEVRVSPGGKVISNSSFGFGRGHDLHRVGVRMTIKKQINWNLLGSIFQQPDTVNSLPYSYDGNDESANDTSIRLEVCGITGVNSYTSLSLQAALERVRETFQCTILQEGVLN